MKSKSLFRLILAIRSGDYYMYEYDSDEEVEAEIEEETNDEATVAQEQVNFDERNVREINEKNPF